MGRPTFGVAVDGSSLDDTCQSLVSFPATLNSIFRVILGQSCKSDDGDKRVDCKMPSAADLATWLLSVFVLIGSTTSSGLSSRSSYTVKEKHHVPSNWARVARASADYEIELHIGLRQARFDELDQRLFEGMSVILPVK